MIDRILISISINKNSFIVESFISISIIKIDVKYERAAHKELKEVIFLYLVLQFKHCISFEVVIFVFKRWSKVNLVQQLGHFKVFLLL